MTPLTPVLGELVRRGARVDAVVSRRYESVLQALGVATATYPVELDAHVERPSSNFLEVAALLANLTRDSLLELSVRHLEATQPQVVVTDSMAPWGRIAAELLGLPVITSTSSFVVSARLGASPATAFDTLRRAREGAAALTEIARTHRALRRARGVGTGGPIRLLSNRGDATLVYTSKELQPGAAHLGSTTHFVGPTAAFRTPSPQPRGDALDAMLAAAASGQRLAYVSLGTIYNERPAFLRAATEALTSLGLLVLLATGDRVTADDLGPLPDGVLAISSAPQLEILDHTSVFVTHGGMNSVHEALWRGVPMVVFPQAADQPVVAARVAELGAGVVLRGREPGVAEIRAAADAVLTGESARHSAALGQGLRSAGGTGAAADLILGFA